MDGSDTACLKTS
uniref:Uncharacterized protein n=1 Tax=Anguilla anguilla TaxID=7936 RepID=A0A0E9PVF1_ANGAN